MARLVPGDQVDEVFQHRIRGGFPRGVEGGQGQSLDDQLHADELQVPARVGEDLVEDALEAEVDGVHQADALLDVLVERFHMAGLVESLGGGVQLGVEGGGAGGQLGGDQQGALLAVQELGEAPGVLMQPELALARLAQPLVGRVARQVHQGRGLLEILIRPGAIPVDVPLRIPVELLAQLVELADAVVLHPVVPVVAAGQRRAENLRHLLHIRAGQPVVDVVRRPGAAGGAGKALNFARRLIHPLQFHAAPLLDSDPNATTPYGLFGRCGIVAFDCIFACHPRVSRWLNRSTPPKQRHHEIREFRKPAELRRPNWRERQVREPTISNKPAISGQDNSGRILSRA